VFFFCDKLLSATIQKAHKACSGMNFMEFSTLDASKILNDSHDQRINVEYSYSEDKQCAVVLFLQINPPFLQSMGRQCF
jgi:hypothetical protein